MNQRNLTKLEKTKRFRRSANSKDEAEDQMSKEEEEGGFRKAEVEKKENFFNSQIKIISNIECQKKLEGVYKIDPTHVCGFSPGSLPFFFRCIVLLLRITRC